MFNTTAGQKRLAGANIHLRFLICSNLAVLVSTLLKKQLPKAKAIWKLQLRPNFEQALTKKHWFEQTCRTYCNDHSWDDVTGLTGFVKLNHLPSTFNVFNGLERSYHSSLSVIQLRTSRWWIGDFMKEIKYVLKISNGEIRT